MHIRDCGPANLITHSIKYVSYFIMITESNCFQKFLNFQDLKSGSSSHDLNFETYKVAHYDYYKMLR